MAIPKARDPRNPDLFKQSRALVTREQPMQPFYGLKNRELNRLSNGIRRFDAKPEEGAPRRSSAESKRVILRMVRELDRLRPPGLAMTEMGGLTMSGMLDQLESMQAEARTAPTPESREQLQQQSRDYMVSILQRMDALGREVVPKRVGVAPAQREKLLRMSHGPFYKFLNDMIEALDDDKQDPQRARANAAPESFADYALHVRHMQAMHKLTSQVADLIRPYRDKPNRWKQDREKLQIKMNYFVGEYEKHAPPSALLQHDIHDALDALRAAHDYDSLREPFMTLRWYPMRSARYCLENLERAYLQDMDGLMRSQMASEPQPQEKPYEQPTRAFDMMYRARWTLAARRLNDMMNRYENTIANPKFEEPTVDAEPAWRAHLDRPERLSVNPAYAGPKRFPGEDSGRSR